MAKDNFEVIVSDVDDNTSVATVAVDIESKLASLDNEILYSAVQNAKQLSNTRGIDIEQSEDVSLSELRDITNGIHNDISSVLRLNSIVRRELIMNVLIGKTFESLYGNINSNYRLYFPDMPGRNKAKTVQRARDIINDFLNQIHIGSFIRDAISMTYVEGNRYFYLRSDNGSYAIDILPMGLCFVSDYIINGQPSLAVNMKELKDRLKKTYPKSKKTKRAVWEENIGNEIKNNYPYVWDAYIAGEEYCRLDTKYAKACRYNNIGRKYGVTPLAKVLPDAIVLENIRKADTTISKMKQRVIICQLMRKELLGSDGRRKGLVETQYAHQQLMSALSTTASVYTASPAVETVMYVQPKIDDTSDNKMAQYIKNVMVGLGIAFTDPELSTTAAGKINLSELMKTINAISDEVNEVLNQYFVTVLEQNGIGAEYAPRIDILDSQALEMEMRKDIASFLYSTLNGSAKTAFELIGLDLETEVMRRTEEKDAGTEDILTPHPTSYNSSSGGTVGRPSSDDPEDPDRQSRDDDRNNA